ncbi:MAG: glycosyltransferase family 9 protein [Candidatus Melainabacteria bacterium]|jgi:heptosyltransferase I|nr:glycosyltransferase family 9 protein [Candidatus Melainabacteria bacterium]
MKILIIKLSSLGDIVHAIPSLNALKQKYPQATIDWLVYKSFAPIIESQRSINKIIKLENKKISSLFEIKNQLKKENYDLVIDMQGLIKTALIARIISSKTRGFKEPREKIAAIFYKERIDAGNIMDDSMHIVERNLLLAQSPIPHSPFNALEQEAKLHKKLCIIPSTTWQTKLWQAEKWAKLIDSIKSSQPELEIYILGTIKELIYIEEIISQTKSPLHIVVNKKLTDLPEFFSAMSTVIGVDTGPLHIAAASLYGSKAQVIGLYGPSSAARTGPYGFQSISATEKPSHKRKNDSSMNLISVEQVLNIVTS